MTPRTGRKGFTLLELQVALAVLGMAFAGLAGLMIMQSRQLKRIESRLGHDAVLYVRPADSPWARELRIRARVDRTPHTRQDRQERGSQSVRLLRVDRDARNGSCTATVAIEERREEE